jgi:DNA-binding MarR family transcriptional regulator
MTLAITTPTCDRLITKKLIIRPTNADDRRHISLVVTHKGRQLVPGVTERRRSDIEKIISAIPLATNWRWPRR